MRAAISSNYRRNLLSGAAVILLGTLASGCSSNVMRFQDSILTGSSYPAQTTTAAAQPYPGGVDNTYTGSVNVASRTPGRPVPSRDVGGGGMAPVQVASAPTYASQPFPQGPAPSSSVTSSTLAPVSGSGIDTTATGTVAQQPAPVQQPAQAPVVASAQPGKAGGWGSGSSSITVQPGETVYNLSRRYGVPVKAIMEANGLSDADQLAAGRQLVIPSYTYTADAPVSAPDNNPKVAAARPTADRSTTPAPTEAPVENVAVLPQQPKLREGGQGAEEPAAAGAARSGDGSSYTVAAGDTLNAIASRTGVSAEQLKAANGLSSGLIRIGQTLVIPTGGNAATKLASAQPAKLDPTSTGATAPAVTAYTPPVKTKAESLVKEASLQTTAPTPDATGIERMRWPVRGRVIAPFGGAVGGKPNDGIDISVPEGTPIKAAENGVVIFAGDGLKDFGNTVLVRHEDGLVTVYGHASELKVGRGDKVRRGQEIALSGMSGAADAPKLHFEVRKDSAPVNPVGYLE